MITIQFIEPMTWFVMVICGLVGALFSGEIILAVLPFWGNTKDENSKILKWLDILMGIIAGVWLTLLIVDDNAQFRWLTVLLFILFMVVSFAHPIKDMDKIAILILPIPFILMSVVAYLVRDSHKKEYDIFGTMIPLWLILSIIALILLILFLIIFFVTEIIMNPILYALGWAPLVFVVGILVLIQGILLLFFPVAGALHFIS